MEVEIGRGKKGRRAYGFDDIAIVPSRRTRDPDDIDITWTLGDYRFELPLLASAMDGVVSPRTAGLMGKLGGLAVLNLEGIFSRYEDAEEQLERIAGFDKDAATAEMQRIYSQPIDQDLMAQRIREVKEQRVVCAASLTPQRVRTHYEAALEAGVDILVIQGTVISAEHVSTDEARPPLNLKEFIREVPVPGRGGRLCLLRHRPAPHAHRRQGRAGGRRPRRGVHHARRARHRRAAGHRDRRRRRGAVAEHAGDGRVREGDRRRRHAQRRRHLEGLRLRRRRRDDRLARSRAPTRLRATATTGAWPPSTPSCRAAPG